MIEKKVVIENSDGINARAAAVFVQVASDFSSTVWMERDGVKVNAKSIMGIMSLALGEGDEILLKVAGADEENAAQELAKVLSAKLD